MKKLVSNLLAGIACVALPAYSHMAAAAEGSAAMVNEGAGGLPEIIVTAQRRGENLQKVPVAVTAVTSESIAATGLQNTSQLMALVPGLRSLSASAADALFFMRGIGQTTGTAGSVSPISIYLDGIYLGYGQMGAVDLNNIEQISVLRGPQGSLFGRNASGGIIQVTTKDPSAQFSGNGSVGYANYNTINANFYATGAITDKLYANISVKAQDSYDGWMTNTVTGHQIAAEKRNSVQQKFLWQPGDDTTVTSNIIWQRASDLPGVAVHAVPGHLLNDGVTGYLGEDKISSRHDPYARTESLIGSLKLTHDFGWARFSNIGFTTRNKVYMHPEYGTPGRPNPNNAPQQSLTMTPTTKTWGDDLQLQAPSGDDFQWIIGGSYGHEHAVNDFTVLLDEALVQHLASNYTTESAAGFLQGTKTIIPGVRLTAGGRYTTEKVALFVRNVLNGQTTANFGLPPSKRFNKATWRGALDVDVTDDVLAYVSANRGFKSGQFNMNAINNPPVNPEVVDSYEVGVKSQLFDHRLRLNAAGFLMNINNLQLKALNGASILLFNAATARVRGMDVDFTGLVTNELTVNGGFEWLPRANYLKFPGASSTRPTPIAATPAGCTGAPNLRVGGTATFICDLSGYRMIFAPKMSLNLGFTYTKDIGNGHSLALNVNDSYSSAYYIDPDHTTQNKGYHLVNMSLTWRLPGDRWHVRAWGTNITYAKTFTDTQFFYIPGEPPRYGVDVGFEF